jgi:hypothetical protein
VIRTDLTIEQYHALAPVSKSQLDTLDLSPAIFYARHRAPDRPAPVAKPGQLEGQLAHCSILEPDEFHKRYAVGPTVNRNTKVWKEFVEANEGAVAIQADQYDTAMRQAESVRKLPEIRDALAVGQAELSAFWTDPETGVHCRCRPDWMHPVGESAAVLIDLKTFTDCGPREFAKQVARKSYAKQDSLYSDGFEIASEREVLGFVFVAVSTEYPYASAAYMLDGQSKDSGRRHYKKNLRTYKECEESGVWHGYSDAIQLISLPNWALESDNA